MSDQTIYKYKTRFPLKRHSLMFAPMEGVTDEHYRGVISKLYPDWDTFSCDFLRVPNPSPYPLKHIIKHFGKDIYTAPNLKKKTVYQILTSPGAYTQKTVEDIDQLGFDWIDLNLGCPSKTVCKHHGGSFLLSELDELKEIVKIIRKSFPGTFTCKIRVGYRDDSNFEKILKMLEEQGVDAIIIHARTRDELYKGVANWDYVKQAVSLVNIPIIGNGDIWSVEDINKYFEYTKCHSVMLGRSALKTPWLAKLYKEKIEETPIIRVAEIKKYYMAIFEKLSEEGVPEVSIIKRIKAISRYLYDDFEQGDQHKRKVLLAKSFKEQMGAVDELSSLFL
jgi:tRNA-dihydrouridine synthase